MAPLLALYWPSSYNLAGSLTSQTYPSGRVVTNEYDEAGRIAGVRKPSGQFYAGALRTDANRIQYAPHGGSEATLLGNGLWEQSRFNSRLQPVFIGLGSTKTTDPASLNSNDSNLLLLNFQYKDNSDDDSKNNGNLSHQTIQVKATQTAPALNLTQHYLYDPLNRLSSAAETGASNTWTQGYGYDRFGNRWVSSGTDVGGYSSWVPQSQPEFNAATNRLVSPSAYDAAGNLTADKVARLFKYDADNKQVEFNPNLSGQPVTQYFYDGDGWRVKKVQGTTTTVFVYNVLGQLLAEYSPQGAAGGTRYLTADHLGSTRAVTDPNGTVDTRHDYLPFGEEISLVNVNYGNRLAIPGFTSSLLDGPNQKFTAKERDSESNLDYFGARYYSGAQGRFTSADTPFADQYESDPQSWNLYHYGRNNPYRFTDPTGRKCVDTSNGKADDGTGGGCPEAGVDENGNIKSHQVTVHADPLIDDLRFQLFRSEFNKANKGNLQFAGLAAGASILGGVALYAGGAFAAPVIQETGIVFDLDALLARLAMAKPNVTNVELEGIIGKLFQVTDKFPGGTAGAVRYENITGELLSKSGHWKKAADVITELGNFLKNNPGISKNDQAVAKELIRDLQNALSGR